MKKLFTSMLCVFIAIPLLLTVWGFALPAQYSNTLVYNLCNRKLRPIQSIIFCRM